MRFIAKRTAQDKRSLFSYNLFPNLTWDISIPDLTNFHFFSGYVIVVDSDVAGRAEQSNLFAFGRKE
jgi:hypothetical protein